MKMEYLHIYILLQVVLNLLEIYCIMPCHCKFSFKKNFEKTKQAGI